MIHKNKDRAGKTEATQPNARIGAESGAENPKREPARKRGRKPREIPGQLSLPFDEPMQDGWQDIPGIPCNGATPPDTKRATGKTDASKPKQTTRATPGIKPRGSRVNVPPDYCEQKRRQTGSVKPVAVATVDAVSVPRNRAEIDKRRQMAESIACLPDILSACGSAIGQAGLVGEQRNAKILYLALTSRLLDRPVSVAVKGDSSTGKSHTTEYVLKFIPESAVIRFSSASPKALVNSDESFEHKFLYFAEAAGMGSKDSGLQSSLRTLLCEGRLVHKRAVPGGGTETITKNGPVGFLTTTTNDKLYSENETRFLSLSSDDSREQTRAVISACLKDLPGDVDLEPWLAFQERLEAAERRVTIPYGETLADLILPVATRLRRDATLLKILITAHAFLHQRNRRMDDEGRIIAEMVDYSAVYALAQEVFSAGVEMSVDPAVRATVEALASITEERGAGSCASVAEVAARLDVNKSTASRRLKKAVEAGYADNAQKKSGMAACYRVTGTMPDDVNVLPLPETVETRWLALREADATVGEHHQA